MHYDAIVVGAGMAGLTSAAFLAKSGHSVLLLEKHDKVGGCVNSFQRDGYVFDGGIRAVENSGVLLPMLRQLGIEMQLVKNDVSIGLGNDVITLRSIDSLADYQSLLEKCFPGDTGDIGKIFSAIRRISGYMDVLYGIDNPLFLDMKKDRKYLVRVLLPWLVKYLMTIRKIERLKEPVRDYLDRISDNESLVDIIAQHFFRDTPAFFALGYLKIYLDYYYPKGGVQTLPDRLMGRVSDLGGEIRVNTEVKAVDPQLRQLSDQEGNIYAYRKLIWAADLKTLYRVLNVDSVEDNRVRTSIVARRKAVADKKGGDSVFTLYLCVDLDRQYFADIATEHLFYTPYSRGLLDAHRIGTSSKEETVESLKEYFKYNTYEIACPALRDPDLAPAGKTGLIVSTLFDYAVTGEIMDKGWYDEFKLLSENTIVDILDGTIYPGIKDRIVSQFSSTPLTLLREHGNSEGAITGWAFTNNEIPVETRLPRIANSVRTPIPDVFQAGQWTFSPSGLPISIITGKLAADAVRKSF
ncbi:MAG: phytoene desaturase family protein [Dehalococcoidia bacterium]